MEETTNNHFIEDSLLGADSDGFPYLGIEAGGSSHPASIDTVQNRRHFLYQEGQIVFKQAIKRMCETYETLMSRNHLTVSDLDWFIPHQANLRIIQALQKRLSIPDEKTIVNIEKYGNTSAGTIPICLWDYQHRFKKGDRLMLVSFGGGFTWAGTLLRWAIN